MQDKRQEILQVAESMVRDSGYNGFSFRHIASEVGIKSASVHYYYPTKEDLASELARRYTDRFIDALGDPASLIDAGKDPIDTYVDQFRTALNKDRRMCLCGILGAEANKLPEAVRQATREFFTRNVNWLTQVYTILGQDNPAHKAIQALSLLEGALVVSIAMGDNDAFENSVLLLRNNELQS